MANEDSALKEVDQELAEERQWEMFRQYGPMVIGGALAIVLGVGGWQFWNARQDSVAKEQALEFRSAVELLAESNDDGRAALQAVAEDGSSGYSVLAAFHRAASFARGGERLAAIEAYREIYGDNGTQRQVRNLARLRAAYLSLSDGRDEVMTDLGDLAEGEGSFSYPAREISGLAALEAEDYETALSIFRQLSIDLGAPESVRERAENFAALASSGKAGVNIRGEAQIDDLLSIVGEDAEVATDIMDTDLLDDDHEGHDHEEALVEDAGATEETETTAPDSEATDNENE